MKWLIAGLVCAGLGLPATAQSTPPQRTVDTDCPDFVRSGVVLLGVIEPQIVIRTQIVDGACRLTVTDNGTPMTGVAVVRPTQTEGLWDIDLSGWRFGPLTYSGVVTVSQTDMLELDIDIDGTDQSGVSGTIVIDVAGPSQANLNVKITPAVLAVEDVDLSRIGPSDIDARLTGVTQQQIGSSARWTMLRFAGATPNAAGTLSIGATSGGMIAPAITALMQNPQPSLSQIARALPLARITLEWRPGQF